MTEPTDTDDDLKRIARNRYWQGGASLAQISRELDVKYQTVVTWKRRDGWDQTPEHKRIEMMVSQRLIGLILKDAKTPQEIAELEQLNRILETTARARRYVETGRLGDLSPAVEERNKKRDEGRKKAQAKRSKERNFISDDDKTALQNDFLNSLYGYQKRWKENQKTQKSRIILKSRQIGATWYFAREAFFDALETGDNQIFLSASKTQALYFRNYIISWVRSITGVQLVGNPIVLQNGAELHFLSTNSKTAQGSHGHLYIDEYAWIGRFDELRKVASAMSSQKKWRTTYFSTPSAQNHASYAFWTGETWNKSRRRADRVDFDVSHENLKDGWIGPDRAWRNIVTVMDAVASGCDLFDLDQLHDEYPPDDFNNLFMCKWVDDELSYFSFAELQRCMVDAFTAWSTDWTPDSYSRPVWIGYDPSRTQDNSAIVIIAPPAIDGGVFRILEVILLRGKGWAEQAATIKQLCDRYNVEKIGMDKTGLGSGVFELVQQFFPSVVGHTYTPELKNHLVLKAKHLIERRLLQWDAGQVGISMSFLAIRKQMTATGNRTTFVAQRSLEHGHADVAFAFMNGLNLAPYSTLPIDDVGTKAGLSSGGTRLDIF